MSTFEAHFITVKGEAWKEMVEKDRITKFAITHLCNPPQFLYLDLSEGKHERIMISGLPVPRTKDNLNIDASKLAQLECSKQVPFIYGNCVYFKLIK